MCTKLNSFDQLSAAYKNSYRVDDFLFEILSNNTSSVTRRAKAIKELDQKAHSILSKLNGKFYLVGSEDVDTYHDYCLNLAAYALLHISDRAAISVLLKIEELLEYLAPTYKPELRTIKKVLKLEGANVQSLGYDWEDLCLPFNATSFANKYVQSIVSEPRLPQFVEVEKVERVETVVEKIVERIIEKPVIITKEPDEDSFGVEDHDVEFKSSFMVPPPNQHIQNQKMEICRKVCGFLNADGGVIYIGVDNNTRRALPESENGFYQGIWGDMRYHISSDRYGNPVTTIEGYAKYVKSEISHILKRSNSDTCDTFINECIHVNPTNHDNVIRIDIKPSKYCVVYLDGIAYQRDGEECKEMNADQIVVRNETRKRIGKEARWEEIIRKAIKHKKQVVLHRYHSANSNSIGDRRVEPYAFVCNNEAVMCYDLDKHAVRQFKLSRIEGVSLLPTDWKNAEKHNEKRTDVFDWTYTGFEYHIQMDMSVKAISHFCEMFSLRTNQDYYPINENEWRVDIRVYSLEPAIGFYLSMAKEITIQESEHAAMFKQGIRDYVRQYVLN